MNQSQGRVNSDQPVLEISEVGRIESFALGRSLLISILEQVVRYTNAHSIFCLSFCFLLLRFQQSSIPLRFQWDKCLSRL